jgi:hypothetical protein
MKNRKDNEESLKQVLERFVKTFQLDEGLLEQEIICAWEKLMGPAVAAKTEFIQYKKGSLKIKLTSAPLRNELEMQKTRLIELLNEELGGSYIATVQLG